MASNLDEILRPNRLALQLLGFWPTIMDNHKRIFARLRLCMSVISLGSLVVPQIYSLGYYWGDVSYLAGIP